MKKLYVLVPMFLILVGCSSKEYQMPERQPTLTFSCASECELVYNDPNYQPAMPTTGWDTANVAIQTVGNVALGVVPWLAVGQIAATGIKNAGDRSTTTTSTDSTHTPVIVNQPDPVIVTQPEPIIFQPTP